MEFGSKRGETGKKVLGFYCRVSLNNSSSVSVVSIGNKGISCGKYEVLGHFSDLFC